MLAHQVEPAGRGLAANDAKARSRRFFRRVRIFPELADRRRFLPTPNASGCSEVLRPRTCHSAEASAGAASNICRDQPLRRDRIR